MTTIEVTGGRAELVDALVHGYIPQGVTGLTSRLGIRGLSWLIREVLDTHYPEDIFPVEGVLYPAWGGEHGGSDIDPGMKWIALLRQALREVPE